IAMGPWKLPSSTNSDARLRATSWWSNDHLHVAYHSGPRLDVDVSTEEFAWLPAATDPSSRVLASGGSHMLVDSGRAAGRYSIVDLAGENTLSWKLPDLVIGPQENTLRAAVSAGSKVAFISSANGSWFWSPDGSAFHMPIRQMDRLQPLPDGRLA